MISRWWLLPIDLLLGSRFGAFYAARDDFHAVRDGQRNRHDTSDTMSPTHRRDITRDVESRKAQ